MSLTEQVSKAQVKNILAKLKAGKTITKNEQAMVAAYDANALPELTLEEVAKHFAVSRPAVLRWKRAMAKDGLPWNNLEAIQTWRDKKTEQTSPSEINAVRKQKLEREVKRLDLRIAEDEGRLINKRMVYEVGVRVISTWCAELDALVGDLPGQIAGLPEADIQPRLRARIELLKSSCKKSFQELE
jgi:hypothetical protein